MAYRVVLSPQAGQDVRETADFIRDQADGERARKWKNGIISAIGSLADMPQRCAVAPESQELGVELRQLLYFSHRVVFRMQEVARTVQVLRVHHFARAPLRMEDLP